ncbi:MAG: hypothetical protein AABY32_01895 [Nanoarchaeota archaeon]
MKYILSDGKKSVTCNEDKIYIFVEDWYNSYEDGNEIQSAAIRAYKAAYITFPNPGPNCIEDWRVKIHRCEYIYHAVLMSGPIATNKISLTVEE